jgi:PAS domain S-box-containing protein
MTEADNDSWNDPIWAILSNVSSMLAYWDRDLRCKFANNAYLHWFGVKGSSLFDTRLQDLLGPELFAANEPFVRGALRGELQEFERLVPGPGGNKRPSLARYIPHKAPNGKVLGFVVEVTDVTLLHDTREQLRLRVAEIENLNFELSDRKRALTIAQNLGDMGSWEWDINTDAITWSEQLYRLFGLDPTSPPPSFADHRALYAPDSWAKLRAAVKHCIDYGTRYTLELEYIKHGGHHGWLEARGFSRRDASGKVVTLYGTAQEISARWITSDAAYQTMRIADLERRLAIEREKNGALESRLARRM